jgi:Rad3-related DNA helicase
LDKLIKIKESYRSEKDKMIEKINDIKLQFINEAKKIDSFDEFGISQEEYLKMVNSQSEMFDLVSQFTENNSLDLIKNIDEANTLEQNENFNPLEEENNTIIYQYHDFKKMKEALANIPPLVDDENYVLYLTLADDKIKNMPLLGIIVQLILDKNKEIKINLTAHSSISNDNKNHLFLLKKYLEFTMK